MGRRRTSELVIKKCEKCGKEMKTNKETQGKLRVGREYNWKKYSPEQLKIHVSHFCTTYTNGIPCHFSRERSFT